MNGHSKKVAKFLLGSKTDFSESFNPESFVTRIPFKMKEHGQEVFKITYKTEDGFIPILLERITSLEERVQKLELKKAEEMLASVKPLIQKLIGSLGGSGGDGSKPKAKKKK